MPPNRAQRAKIAQETLEIIRQGHYTNDKGENIDISDALTSAASNSRVWTERDLDDLRSSPRVLGDGSSPMCPIEVTSEHSIAACLRVAKQEKEVKIACLNFASAKNVCGGMLGGSLAQEESLGLCSGLYGCLDQFQKEYYGVNRGNPRKGLYHDHLVYSAGVPVFREDEELKFLDRPVLVDFISCPAVNKGRAISEADCTNDKVNEIMRRRIENVLTVSSRQSANVLILGAWGCGVFKNEPKDMAENFRAKLEGVRAFNKVIFAVGREKPKQDIFRQVMLSESQ